MSDGFHGWESVLVSDAMASLLAAIYGVEVAEVAAVAPLVETAAKDIAGGTVPFRCSKGRTPGPPCGRPATLQSDKGGIALFHAQHAWESVYVSQGMADFLQKFVFPLVSVNLL